MASPFENAGMGQFGKESQYFSKDGSGVSPLSYMAGYALDKFTGGSEMGQKMMGMAPVPPTPGMTQPTLPPGLSVPSSGFANGLAAPRSGVDPNTFVSIGGLPTTYPTYDFSSTQQTANFNNLSPALASWSSHIQSKGQQ
tara:strand:- start:2103 stop:2522 length:420 start_codon:yes stop_codon:yes gene_type:complete